MARVVIENLSKVFKGAKEEEILAVKDATLTIEDGELLALVGPSGCGKSTTLRMIAGLEEITAGTVSIDGKVLNDVEPKDRDIAMVFQNFALYPHMTARENLAFGLTLRKVARSEIEARVAKAADILGLRDCLERRPSELSGGERQRVAVGRAIVREPKVFLFDEPLSNLDAPMRVQMRREMAALHKRLGATMIYVTHDQVEAMTLGQRIAIMRAGEIQQVAKPMMLYREPANMFVAGFIGSPAMNFFHGTLDENEVFTAQPERGSGAVGFKVKAQSNSSLKEYIGKAVVMGLRPENIVCGPATAEEAVEAVAEVIEPLGAETYLYAVREGCSFVARMREGDSVTAGQKVSLALDMKHAHFFDATTEKIIGR